MAEKRRCENCGRAMKQQFIGLKHCRCGTSWQKGVGYFQRTGDMVFALERKVTKKGENSVRTKQVPVIRHRDTADENPGAPCIACKGNMRKVDCCKRLLFTADGKPYTRVKVGGGDMYGGSGGDTRCTGCGAKYGHYHHFRCGCEACPICDRQLLTCGCALFTTKT